jgi:uncharacterized integral membrane protein
MLSALPVIIIGALVGGALIGMAIGFLLGATDEETRRAGDKWAGPFTP